ncbi:MAG: AMP-binding protein [Granulosicoccus sp.]|nr:AMP-binding protein [Granulosicoccus sp.]
MNTTNNGTLPALLSLQAERNPRDVFVIFERQSGSVEGPAVEQQWSYGSFDRQVNQTCRFLQELGISQGEVVNLHLPNCPAFLLLWFALARLGAVMMPTNVLASASEMEYLLTHSGSVYAFSVKSCENTLSGISNLPDSLRQVIYCDDPERGFETRIAGYSDAAFEIELQPGDLAAIMYTSGTTSRPKGVMVTHANYIRAGTTVAQTINLQRNDRHYVVLPLFHGNAQYYSVMSALVCGASVALMDRFSASRYFDRCVYHHCTVASLFAAPMRMILAQPEKPEDRDNDLRGIIFAQSLTAEQLDDWDRRFGAPLGQLWGMTETMGPPLMNRWDTKPRNQTIGMPVGGYDVRIVNSNGRQVAAGETGEIVVRGVPGETIMLGYFKNQQATDSTIRDGWLYTGDNAYQDPDGYFVFVDRVKDMIKRSGENVSAGEVESVIQQHPAVFECAVVGLPDEMRDEKIVAVVVLKPEQKLDAETLITYCRKHLASFRVPQEVVFQATMPKTSVGKIMKHVIKHNLLSKASTLS